MNHQGTKRLETARLTLRRFTAADAESMFRNWASDPAVTKYLTWPPHADAAASRRILEEWEAAYRQPTYYQWAIELRGLGEPVGSISVVHGDEALGILEIGYCIGRRWWGQGITAEAFSRVIAFLFEEVGAKQIRARHDPRNPNSGRVMRKCGLRFDSAPRQSDRNNLGVTDLWEYGLTDAEYVQRRDERPGAVTLEPVEAENLSAVLALELKPEQARFVSPPVRSLAWAWAYRGQCRPYAFAVGGEPVGYALLLYDYDLAEYDIWHVMVDASHQGKGYGRAGMEALLRLIGGRPFGEGKRVAITCSPENAAAMHLYESLGFAPTGERDGDEIELALPLGRKAREST